MAPSTPPEDHFDVVVIGAGAAGLYALHLLRGKGLRVRVLEAGDGVGGVWYWNRYPGARLHSESHSYQYFFDEELLEEWDWSELFAGQPELERYFNRVADKHDLRRDIELGTRVASMAFDEAGGTWTVRSEDGRSWTSRVVLSATGPLAEPVYPDVPGRESFAGQSFHTARWPHEPVEVAGKRVVVIGVGSTGVQVIPQLAKDAAHLSVLMRTPNWVVPLNNRPFDAAEMAELRAGYPQLREHLASTFGGFIHQPGTRPTTDHSPEELLDLYETAWAGPGFTKYFGMPYDVLSDETANRHFAEWVAAKIGTRVEDPETAAALVPPHPFGAKPVDCESAGYQGDGYGYYEVFNLPHVELVPLRDNPMVEVVPEGIRLADGRLVEADLIVYATGFEAFVGSLNHIDIRGVGGQSLRERWADGPETYLGIGVSGFPNLFMVGGPHGKGGHGNSTRCSEFPLEWIADLAEKVVRGGWRVEPDRLAEEAWTEQVLAAGNANLMSKARSFLYGDNVPGRRRGYVAYIGALPDFVDRLRSVESHDYEGFVISR